MNASNQPSTLVPSAHEALRKAVEEVLFKDKNDPRFTTLSDIGEQIVAAIAPHFPLPSALPAGQEGAEAVKEALVQAMRDCGMHGLYQHKVDYIMDALRPLLAPPPAQADGKRRKEAERIVEDNIPYHTEVQKQKFIQLLVDFAAHPPRPARTEEEQDESIVRQLCVLHGCVPELVVERCKLDRARRDSALEALRSHPNVEHLADERGPCLCRHCEWVRKVAALAAQPKEGQQ